MRKRRSRRRLGPGPAGTRLGALTTDGRNRVILAGSAPLHEGRGFVVVRLNAADGV